MKNFILSLMLVIACGCGKFQFNLKSSPANSLGGRVLPLSGIAAVKNDYLIQSAYAAATCDDDVYAQLYRLEDDGSLPVQPLASTLVENGIYSFAGTSLPADIFTDTIRYQIKISGCDEIYYRPVTNVDSSQDVSYATTLIGNVTQAILTKTLIEANKADVGELLNKFTGSDIISAYNNLVTRVAASDKFQEIFQDHPSRLTDSYPLISVLNYSSSLTEGTATTYKVSGYHFYPAYPIAYEWILDGVYQSNHHTWIYAPTADASGQYVLTLLVGKDDGAGRVDRAKPFYSRSETVTVFNTLPATPPSISLASAYSNTSNVNLTIDVGAGLSNCGSFSTFLLTQSGTTPLASDASFTETCSGGPSQAAAFTLTGADGLKTISLWVRDSAGNVSAAASSVSLTIDRAAPTVSFGTIPAYIRGGETVSVSFSAADLTSGISSLKLRYASDGVTFSDLANLSGSDTSYSWAVPATDTATSKLRLEVIDRAGNQTVVDSSGFGIDNTVPAAPVVALASGTPTASTAATFTISSCADIQKIFFSTSTTKPALAAAGWQNCSTSAAAFSQTLSAGDGTKTFYVFSQDAVGNISSAYATVSAVLDQTPPVLSLGTVTNLRGARSSSFTWSLTDAHATNAVPMVVEFYNGTAWSTVGTVSPTSGNNAAAAYTLSNYTVPLGNTLAARLRVTATDALGFSTTVESSDFTLDSVSPVISLFQLAGGSGTTALPNVTTTLTASDPSSGGVSTGVSEMQFSETASPSAGAWLPYSASSFFALSLLNGDKNVSAWVRDAVGNESAAELRTIKLDFGSPPTVTISSPAAQSTYAPGDTVPISWSCQSSNGLAPNPVAFIKYTIDDGAVFFDIASDLPNNDTATTGHYDWTLPNEAPTTPIPTSLLNKPFRILVGCKSQAGVINSAFSQPVSSGGWSIFMGDPTYNKKDVNASVALVSSGTTSASTVIADRFGTIFYRKDHAIMEINRFTGLVNEFAGVQSASGCALVQGQTARGVSGAFTEPTIIGSDLTGEKLFVLNIATGCERIFKIDSVSGIVEDIWNVSLPYAPGIRYNFLAGGRYFIYVRPARGLFLVDLGTTGSVPVKIHGTATDTTSTPTVGADALLTPMTASWGNKYQVVATPDAKKIWLNGSVNTYRLDDPEGDGSYTIGAINLDSRRGYSRCTPTRFDSKIYCSFADVARTFVVFDPSTETFSSAYTHPFVNNDHSGFLTLGSGQTQLFSLYSLNTLSAINTTNLSSASSYVTYAGQPISIFGNGSDPKLVAFGDIFDLQYFSSNKKLYIANQGHFRFVDMNPPYTTSSALASLSLNARVAVKLNQASFVHAFNGCSGSYYLGRHVMATFVQTYLLNAACPPPSRTYPLPDGSPVNTGAESFSFALLQARFTTNNTDVDNLPVDHSNGTAYLSGQANGSDVFIFNITATVVNRVAGTTGPGTHDPLDHGTAALGANLKNVKIMREIPSGDYAGDLLIWDGDFLRRISIASENAGDPCPNGGVAPCIYDVLDYKIALGYTPGTYFIDAIYDPTTEISGVLGSGTTYYIDANFNVHKFLPASVSGQDIVTATDTSYTLTGTTLAGATRLALTPAGLLITQPMKNRIIRVTP